MSLSATLSKASDADGPRIEVTITNSGAAPVTISTVTFAPSLAFEVTDAEGAPVPLGPPPVPPSDLAATTATIDAGAALDLSYRAGELFGGAAPRGRHRLRFAAELPPVQGAWSGRITSDWLTVDFA